MSTPIQRPDVGEALRQYFRLVGRVRPTLEEYVVPVVSVGDLAQGGAPAASAQASFSIVKTAGGAGNYSGFRLEVPGGMIARIDQIWLQTSTAGLGEFKFTGTGAGFGNSANKAFTDGRLTDQGLEPATVVTFGNRASGLSGEHSIVRVTVDGVILEPGWVVGSGRPDQFGFLEFGLVTANTDLNATILVTEFPLV